MPSAPAQAQPLQDQIHQQGVSSFTRSTSMESALQSLSKSSDSGDDGWTDENMAELEKEMGLALGEHQVESSLAGTPTSPKSSFGRGPTGRNPESRTERNH